jgi:hypothetical protein
MMENYKDDIRNTRLGSLGGSDGNLLAQVAKLGYVPNSAKKRLAVMKSLIEKEDITTRVMRYGDFIEQSIYSHLQEIDNRYQSNPLWISGKYSKDGVRLICHPDFVLFDDTKKVLRVYECKATKFNPLHTRDTYINQLFIEWTLANEIVKAKGEGWKVEMYLCHYDTSNVNIDDDFLFDPDLLSIHRLRMPKNLFDIDKAMTIVSEFSSTFDYYTEDEEIDSVYLPEKVKAYFDKVTGILAEIKEREVKVNEFKRKLCDFMQTHEIKSVKNDAWNITLVGATEQVSFDSKKFLSDLAAKHPRKEKKLRKEYEKRIAKGAFVKITIKTKKDNNN